MYPVCTAAGDDRCSRRPDAHDRLGTMSRREAVLSAAAVFAIALVVRWYAATLVVFPKPEDTAYYVDVARNLLSGRGLVSDALWSFQTPAARRAAGRLRSLAAAPDIRRGDPDGHPRLDLRRRPGELDTDRVARARAGMAPGRRCRRGTPAAAGPRPHARDRQRRDGGGVAAVDPSLDAAGFNDAVRRADPARGPPHDQARSADRGANAVPRYCRLARRTRAGSRPRRPDEKRGVVARSRLGRPHCPPADVISRSAHRGRNPGRGCACRVRSVDASRPARVREPAPGPGADERPVDQRHRHLRVAGPADASGATSRSASPGSCSSGVTGIGYNLFDVLLLPGAPLSFIGLVGLPWVARSRSLRPLVVVSVVVVLETGLLFPVSTTWGTFLHAAGAIHVLLIVSSLLVLDSVIVAIGRRRGWDRPVAWLAPAMTASGAILFSALLLPSFGAGSAVTRRQFVDLDTRLDEVGLTAAASRPLITDAPIWLPYTHGGTALALPYESPVERPRPRPAVRGRGSRQRRRGSSVSGGDRNRQRPSGTLLRGRHPAADVGPRWPRLRHAPGVSGRLPMSGSYTPKPMDAARSSDDTRPVRDPRIDGLRAEASDAVGASAAALREVDEPLSDRLRRRARTLAVGARRA